MNDIPKVEDLLQLNIFLYDIDFVDGELIRELVRRSNQYMTKCQSLTLWQSQLLRQQRHRLIQSLQNQYLWHIYFKDW